MKSALLSILIWFGVMAPVVADDAILPSPLNTILTKIRPGMTMVEVQAVLKPAYENVEVIGGEWSGKTGCVAYKLDDRYTLCIGVKIRQGEQGREEVVGERLSFDLTDRLRKTRIDVSVSNW